MTTQHVRRDAESAQDSAVAASEATRTAAGSVGRAGRAALQVASDVVSDGAHAVVGAVDLAVAKMRGRSYAPLLGGEGPLATRLATAVDRLSVRGRRLTGHAKRWTRARAHSDESETERTIRRARESVEAALADSARHASTDPEPPLHQPGKPYENRTLDELLRLAAERDIAGRSSMTKEDLIAALRS